MNSMTITIYKNGEVFVPDKLIGYVGELESRTIEFVFDEIIEPTVGDIGYVLRLLYSDGLIYDLDIMGWADPSTGKSGYSCAVGGSVLREAGRIKAQWLAVHKDQNEGEYTYIFKSKMFELIIGDSIGDNSEGIPTYEEIINAATQLVEAGMTREQVITAIEQIVRTGEVEDLDTGFVTTLKEILHGTGFRIGVDTYDALLELKESGEMEENVLYIPSDGDDTGWTPLLIGIGWHEYTFDGETEAQKAQIRRIGNHVYIRGVVSNPSISTNLTDKKVIAYIPQSMRPKRHIFKMTSGSTLTVARLETNSGGDLFIRCVFDLESGTRQTSCPWLCIDMDYSID